MSRNFYVDNSSPFFRSAFTLIEMLIVLTIILILGGLTVAFLDRGGENRALVLAAEQIRDLVRQAQVTARSTESEVVISLTRGESSGNGRALTLVSGTVMEPLFGEAFERSWFAYSQEDVSLKQFISRREDTFSQTDFIPFIPGEGGYGWDPILAQDLRGAYSPPVAGARESHEVLAYNRHYLRRWNTDPRTGKIVEFQREKRFIPARTSHSQ